MSWTRTTIIILKWTGESPRSFNPTQWSTGAKECWEWEKLSFPGKRTPIGCPVTNGEPWKHIHTSNITQTKQAVFMHLGTHIHKQLIIIIKEAMNSKEQIIWKNLKAGKGRDQWYNYTWISKLLTKGGNITRILWFLVAIQSGFKISETIHSPIRLLRSHSYGL